jgi:hypothetical protein
MNTSLIEADYSELEKRVLAHQIRPRGKSWLPAIFRELEAKGLTPTGRPQPKPDLIIFDECLKVSSKAWAQLGTGCNPELIYMTGRSSGKTWMTWALLQKHREAGRVAINQAVQTFLSSFKG